MVAAWEAGQQDKSVGELLADLSDELRRLAHAEVRLAVTEAKRKARRASMGAAAFGVAAVLGLGALGVLIASATLALQQVLPGWLAALLVGVGVLLLAGMCALVGGVALKRAMPPVPQWTINSVRDDVETIRKGVHR
ncbi:MAG TPA: phage holin family protein [Pseudonocardiaceae bacterium]|jgi:protein-S-isoprenylcysteine O-methyltransferase Ste14|nr:phage holin family protein [Pseudonocardiaceae bacterium]